VTDPGGGDPGGQLCLDALMCGEMSCMFDVDDGHGGLETIFDLSCIEAECGGGMSPAQGTAWEELLGCVTDACDAGDGTASIACYSDALYNTACVAEMNACEGGGGAF
jgi:hypothetical protein